MRVLYRSSGDWSSLLTRGESSVRALFFITVKLSLGWVTVAEITGGGKDEAEDGEGVEAVAGATDGVVLTFTGWA